MCDGNDSDAESLGPDLAPCYVVDATISVTVCPQFGRKGGIYDIPERSDLA